MRRKELSCVLLTIRDVMDLLGVSRWTVNNLITRRELKACRIGRLVKIHKDDFAIFVTKVRRLKPLTKTQDK